MDNWGQGFAESEAIANPDVYLHGSARSLYTWGNVYIEIFGHDLTPQVTLSTESDAVTLNASRRTVSGQEVKCDLGSHEQSRSLSWTLHLQLHDFFKVLHPLSSPYRYCLLFTIPATAVRFRVPTLDTMEPFLTSSRIQLLPKVGKVGQDVQYEPVPVGGTAEGVPADEGHEEEEEEEVCVPSSDQEGCVASFEIEDGQSSIGD